MDYDLVIVGGGLAGSSIGAAIASKGARVLIIERDVEFRDRIRGEGMLPWGVAEARELGIYQPLLDSCAIETRWWTTPDDNRDLAATTPSGLGCLNFYHPEMQQRLLDHAVAAGAELLRPAEVTHVAPGTPPSVCARWNGVERRITARWSAQTDATRRCGFQPASRCSGIRNVSPPSTLYTESSRCRKMRFNSFRTLKCSGSRSSSRSAADASAPISSSSTALVRR
jgi:hypothetical protein